MVEPGIEPGTSRLVARNSDHQATRLVIHFAQEKGCTAMVVLLTLAILKHRTATQFTAQNYATPPSINNLVPVVPKMSLHDINLPYGNAYKYTTNVK